MLFERRTCDHRTEKWSQWETITAEQFRAEVPESVFQHSLRWFQWPDRTIVHDAKEYREKRAEWRKGEWSE